MKEDKSFIIIKHNKYLPLFLSMVGINQIALAIWGRSTLRFTVFIVIISILILLGTLEFRRKIVLTILDDKILFNLTEINSIEIKNITVSKSQININKLKGNRFRVGFQFWLKKKDVEAGTTFLIEFANRNNIDLNHQI